MKKILFTAISIIVLPLGVYAENIPQKVKLVYKPKVGITAFYRNDNININFMPPSPPLNLENTITQTTRQEYSDTILEVDEKGIITKIIHFSSHTQEQVCSDKNMQETYEKNKKYIQESWSMQDKNVGIRMLPNGKIIDSESYFDLTPEEIKAKGADSWKRLDCTPKTGQNHV